VVSQHIIGLSRKGDFVRNRPVNGLTYRGEEQPSFGKRSIAMKTRTVYRKISVRRSPLPRRSGASASGSFGSMLARLGFAGEQLKAARTRIR